MSENNILRNFSQASEKTMAQKQPF